MARTRSFIWLIALALTALFAATASASDGAKVANFGLADHPYGSPGFERLTFRSDARGKAIHYAYGPDAREVELKATGTGEQGLVLRFPNGLILNVRPKGNQLEVTDRQGKYRRLFNWLYEGPVDGRGTFCTSCLPEEEAVRFVEQEFINVGNVASTANLFRIGTTGIHCVKAPCPWRGIMPVTAENRSTGWPIWSGTDVPPVNASPADRERIAASWTNDGCLIVEGAMEGQGFTVHRIRSDC